MKWDRSPIAEATSPGRADRSCSGPPRPAASRTVPRRAGDSPRGRAQGAFLSVCRRRCTWQEVVVVFALAAVFYVAGAAEELATDDSAEFQMLAPMTVISGGRCASSGLVRIV